MATCTFFGHRECPDSIKSQLYEVLTELITEFGVSMFFVGNQGQFDAIVRNVLRQLQEEYTWIDYAVVLAYMPGVKQEYEDDSDTMLPEGIELVPPRYAISWRNNWMLKQADYVVSYITHSWGGAAQFAQKAAKQGKTVVELQPLLDIKKKQPSTTG